jgi:hypothetical protein
MIAYEEVLATLQKPQKELTTEKEIYIRECIDWFLYFIDRMEHYIQIELINFAGVEAVLRPYVRRIKANLNAYENILKAQDYDLARAFFCRYESVVAPNSGNPS